MVGTVLRVNYQTRGAPAMSSDLSPTETKQPQRVWAFCAKFVSLQIVQVCSFGWGVADY